MSEPTRIRIDRLSVRLRGVPPATARAAGDGLGADLAARLAAGGLGSAALGDVAAGRVRVPRGARSDEVRAAVAGEVSRALAARTQGEAG